jgi:hypothetical protein
MSENKFELMTGIISDMMKIKNHREKITAIKQKLIFDCHHQNAALYFSPDTNSMSKAI